ncbi:MAG TPA: FAD-binding oxidoreductase [Candidatus Saccharimonadales bacterium]|jgi:FAD/FMN-containing dehydrogenase|nr:FAD-binding oxidoreductase [Candidatus Saccharimonadales bacterium]
MDDVYAGLIKAGFEGETDDELATLELYSHDASMFELRPRLVAKPKDAKDVERLVAVVADLKKHDKKLSLTARAAGTDMSGGAINDSIIVDFREHFTAIEKVTDKTAQVQPGVLYREFEPETLKHGALMPSYPASRDLASVGGMVNNNSGGEKSLEFGKTENFVTALDFVFADGVKRTIKPLNKAELAKKIKQNDFEGQVYGKLYKLLEDNYDAVKAAKPHVSKNSTGYNLWDVWDRDKGVFDLTKLIVGAQGTLGFVTDIHFRLVPSRKHSGLLILFMKDIADLGEVIPKVLESKPATFESFDDATMWLGIKFMPSFHKMLGWTGVIKLLLSFIPTGFHMFRGIPKLILMVEFNGETEEEVRQKVKALHRELKHHRARYEINGFEEDPTEGKSEKFWLMRRYSFQLLRSKVKDKHTAPFIDDFVVPPKNLTAFLPKLRAVIKKYKLFATIAGHMGDGNFHVIPLMKLEDPKDRHKILPAMKAVNKLVLKYGGSLSGEHNDGLVRGPWLKEMYGPHTYKLFQETKDIMDPQHIFNPHKKATADWEYSFSHIRDHF